MSSNKPLAVGQVIGSSPISSTIDSHLRVAVFFIKRRTDCSGSDHRFEYYIVHQKKKNHTVRCGFLFMYGRKDSNRFYATVRWTVAREGLTERNHNFLSHKTKENANESDTVRVECRPNRDGTFFLPESGKKINTTRIFFIWKKRYGIVSLACCVHSKTGTVTGKRG